ncbi:MAG TPA: phosphate transport system regulator PhoU, partial [Pusillimonas sp.]|nr:phosphate transport system regulator PhoU [Pusillimonas sp.]
MTEHTNKQFSAELENVRSSFLQMGGLVEAMIGEAMNVLVNKEVNQADTVHDREKEVNRLEVEIDERIGLLIARNQPTAVDLRLLLSV